MCVRESACTVCFHYHGHLHHPSTCVLRARVCFALSSAMTTHGGGTSATAAAAAAVSVVSSAFHPTHTQMMGDRLSCVTFSSSTVLRTDALVTFYMIMLLSCVLGFSTNGNIVKGSFYLTIGRGRSEYVRNETIKRSHRFRGLCLCARVNGCVDEFDVRD